MKTTTFAQSDRAASLLGDLARKLEAKGTGWDFTIASLLRLNSGLLYNRAQMLLYAQGPSSRETDLYGKILTLHAHDAMARHAADKKASFVAYLPQQSPKDRVEEARAFLELAREVDLEGNPELVTYRRTFRHYAADLLEPLPKLRAMADGIRARMTAEEARLEK